MSKKNQELADQLNSLQSQSVNIVEGAISSGANPGSSVTFTYRTPDGQTATATGTAWNQCTPSKASCLQMADGQWIVVGQHETARVRSSIHVDRRARPVEKKGGNIKILFSVIEGADLNYYIGGDRATPKKVYTIPATAIDSQSAVINNAGDGDRYFVAIIWALSDSDTDPPHRVVITPSQTWDTTDGYPLYGGAGSLSYMGFGFWTQAPTIPQDDLVNFYYGTPRIEMPIGLFVGYGVATGNDRTKTTARRVVYPPNVVTGSGSLTRSDTPSSPTVSVITETGSYNFTSEVSSLFEGTISRTLATLSSQTNSHGTVQFNAQYHSPTNLSGTANWSGSQNFPLQLSPLVEKTSTTFYQYSGSDSQSVDQFGGYGEGLIIRDGVGLFGFRNVMGTLTVIYDSSQPILVGDQKQSLYRHYGVNRTTVFDRYSQLTSQSFGTPKFSDYYLSDSTNEVKLGGALPLDPQSAANIKFSVSDNLVSSRCFRVQLDSAIFSRPLRLATDIYQLSEATAKTTIQAKAYKITAPSSGLPTDQSSLDALTTQLRSLNGQVRVGNIVVYSASYHP